MLEHIDLMDTRELSEEPAAKILEIFRSMEREIKRGGRVCLGVE